MKYNKFEDRAIAILRDHMSDLHLRPQWSKIVKLMNSHRTDLNHLKTSDQDAYTISMVRNRHQRMTKHEMKRKRNICNKCGSLYRGHTCLGEHTEEDVVEVVCNILGIDTPTIRQDENVEEPSLSNGACVEFLTNDMLKCRGYDTHSLLTLLQTYDETPEPLEKYQKAWDSI